MLTPAQIASLTHILEPQQLLTAPSLLAAYEIDGSVFKGRPDAVALPTSPDQVVRLAAWSLENKVPLVGRGSGTGLTGGSVAPNGGVVVSFTRMKQILAIDPLAMQVTVEPGIITQVLQNQLASQGLYYPPDPASYSVSSIGGNIAENAGGPHCLKYGITRHYVQALQVVLAGGETLWLGSPALDPPEFDFVSLFTGSEGTLGLITAATLRLRRQPNSVKALTASFASVEIAGRAVSAVIGASLLPATIELMDHFMISIVEDYLHAGFPTQAGAMLIFDVDGYPQSLDAQLDEIAAILQRFDPIEVKIARTAEQRETIWLGRRSSSGALARLSASHYGVDICVPRSRLGEIFQTIHTLSQEASLRVGYVAHAGDGNLHPLVLCNLEDPEEAARVHQLSDQILQAAAAMGGTIGGEHGTGIEKRNALPYMYNELELQAMQQLQQVFDPQGLLNPGLIFPFERSSLPTPAEPPTGAPLELPHESYYPYRAEDAAEALRQLQLERRPVSLRGGSSQWRGDGFGLRLCTTDMDRILEISTDDFYVRLQPGVRLAVLQAELAALGYWLPAASPWPVTVGGLVSSGLGSPLRQRYTALRELLLSLQVALPDGRLLRFGRPLVKDVAGYDMARLFVGAHGSLGMLTELHLKISALPRRILGLHIPTESFDQALDLAQMLHSRASLAAGLLLTPQGSEGWSLDLSLHGHPDDVQAELETLKRLLGSSSSPTLQISDEDLALHAWAGALEPAAFAARLAVVPGKLASLPAHIDHNSQERLVALDYPSGTAYFTLPEADQVAAQSLLGAMQHAAAPLDGHAVWMAGPRPWLPSLGAWGPDRPALPYMRRLKDLWDPAHIINRAETMV